MGHRRISSRRGAAAFIRRVGLALVYPAQDLVLPSLWEAVSGQSEITWAVRDDHGYFIEFTPEFERVWRWKDELPEQRLAAVGKHIHGRAALVSLAMIAPLYALTGRLGRPDDFRGANLRGLERDVAEAVLELGPHSTPDLTDLLGSERKQTSAAVDALQRQLVLTCAGAQERRQGWPAVISDLLARRFAPQLRGLPTAENSRAQLAECVLRSAGDLAAADLAAIMGGPQRLASATLDRLVDEGAARRRQDDGIMIWRATRPRAGAGRPA